MTDSSRSASSSPTISASSSFMDTVSLSVLMSRSFVSSPTPNATTGSSCTSNVSTKMRDMLFFTPSFIFLYPTK